MWFHHLTWLQSKRFVDLLSFYSRRNARVLEICHAVAYARTKTRDHLAWNPWLGLPKACDEQGFEL